MITIHRGTLSQLLAHCRGVMPEEACGVLLGERQRSGVFHIERVVPVANAAADRLHAFSFEPTEWVDLFLRASGSIVGIYHSHPQSEAVPSREDLDRLHYAFPTYWIVSLARPAEPSVRAFADIRAEGSPIEMPIRLLQPIPTRSNSQQNGKGGAFQCRLK